MAEKAVEDTVLRAPFDGIVARRLVEDFQNVQAKEPVLVVQGHLLAADRNQYPGAGRLYR